MAVRARQQRIPERVEQAHIVQLTRSVGGRAWVLGTTRRRGDFHGTMQTPGIADLVLFIPTVPLGRELVFFEVKGEGGRLRPEQIDFRDMCQAAKVTHLVGGLDTFIALLVARGLVKAENVPHYRQPKEATCPDAQ